MIAVMKFLVQFLVLVLCLFTTTPRLSAAAIAKLFNSGVNDAGTLLGPDETDPHYQLTASADPTAPGPSVFTLVPGFPVGPWIEEGPLSRWIAPQGNQSSGNEPGTYTFTTTFDLTGMNPATAQISGRMSADNSVTGVRLNGSDLGVTAGGFNVWTPFAIPVGSPFAAGTNTLEFDVSNAGDTINPAGFRVEMTGRVTGSGDAPAIIVQPQSQTVIVGDVATFTVDADGTAPLNYQWRFQGNPINGATQPNYTLTGITTNQAGDYSVSISNAIGATISTNARLTVWVPFPGIYNTGLADNRQLIADGATDPHYRLALNPNDPGTVTTVVEDSTVFPIVAGPWVPNTVKSKWIGPLPETSAAAAGDYRYQLPLNLTGYDPQTAILAGSWATDDGGSLYLNGADTGFRSPGFTSFSTFTFRLGHKYPRVPPQQWRGGLYRIARRTTAREGRHTNRNCFQPARGDAAAECDASHNRRAHLDGSSRWNSAFELSMATERHAAAGRNQCGPGSAPNSSRQCWKLYGARLQFGRSHQQ
jgi:hypothetical protein